MVISQVAADLTIPADLAALDILYILHICISAGIGSHKQPSTATNTHPHRQSEATDGCGIVSAELGRFGFVSCFVSTPKRAKPISESRLSRTGHSSPINSFYRLPHQTSTILGNGYTRFRPDSIYSGRILSTPDGYCSFRTGSVHSERMQDIRGVSGTSI